MTPLTVADHIADLRFAGVLDGASQVGEAAAGERLVVRLGLWVDGQGCVRRARYRASTCASLLAYAEAACALAESGVPLDALGPERLRAAVRGVHPVHLDRAALVALALARAVRPDHPAAPGAYP